jgi:hypothetical protein
MGQNDHRLNERVAKLEQRMDNMEEKILGELSERREVQRTILDRLAIIDRKVWMAMGFLTAAQLGLTIFLKWVFSH